jgi:hypothetical protein
VDTARGHAAVDAPRAGFSPLHYYLDAAYGILLKGAGMDLLWDSVLAMGARA